MKKKIKSAKAAKALVVQTTPQEIKKSEPFAWTDEQIDLIKSNVAKGATDDELKLFLYTAKRTGLDPLTKQIHFVKRGGQMTIQTGIDGYRAIAERTGQLAGIDDAVYEGTTKEPIKATVNVYRMVQGQRVAFTASARWSEYVAFGPLWKKMPFLMLGKCAEALALRKAFPNNLSGIYTNEEMEQAGGGATNIPKEPQTIDSGAVKPAIAEVKTESQTTIEQLKKSIFKSLKILEPSITPTNVSELVKKRTSLDLVETNYAEIEARLLILASEFKENKKHETS